VLSISGSQNFLTNVRIKSALSVFGFTQKDIFISCISSVPPCLINQPSVDLSLSNFAKAETNPEVFKSKFLEICDDLQGFCQIYTDGYKTNNGTAAAAVSGDVGSGACESSVMLASSLQN